MRVRAMAETEGRGHESNLGEDVKRRMFILRADVEMEKKVAAMNTTLDNVGAGFRYTLTDKTELMVAVGGVAALAARMYSTRWRWAEVIQNCVGRILGQPSLIRESAGMYFWSGFLSGHGRTKTVAPLKDVILHSTLQKRIEQLWNVTANSRIDQAPLRLMLFCGPSGTGTTMAAAEFARNLD